MNLEEENNQLKEDLIKTNNKLISRNEALIKRNEILIKVLTERDNLKQKLEKIEKLNNSPMATNARYYHSKLKEILKENKDE